MVLNDPDVLFQGILDNNRRLIAKTMTLIESNLPAHQQVAQQVMERLLPLTGKSIRLGITGVPGVGKSTFIENLGVYLADAGHRVAVLAVDPTSQRSGGSILGDKTRMEKLSAHENSFIRDYFTFDFRLRNILLAISKRKFKLDKIHLLEVGEDEVINKLKISTANDFGLGMDADYIQSLVDAFAKDDIVYREKFIDQLRWDMIDQINTFSYFKVDVLLGYLLKLMIVERWIAMSANRGEQALAKISKLDTELMNQ